MNRTATAKALAWSCLVAANIASAAEFTTLEEVVVTATRRSQALQDVGMSITALTERDLENMGVDDYSDFSVARARKVEFSN